MRYIGQGSSGGWSVEHIVIKNKRSPRPLACGLEDAPPGAYTLLRDPLGGVNMCDSPTLIEDQREVVQGAAGHIVVCGLGLGVVVNMLLDVEEVTRVTIIENSHAVARLILPTYTTDDRVRAIMGDAENLSLEYLRKLPRIDRVWLDIWPTDEENTLDDRWNSIRQWSQVCDWVGVSAMRRMQSQCQR